MSARAFNICDVSAAGGAAAVALFPFVSFSGIKSLGGDIVGVVDRGSTIHRENQKACNDGLSCLPMKDFGLPYLSRAKYSTSA